METKDFEHLINFFEHHKPDWEVIYLPLIEVTVVIPDSRTTLSLLFDTGATSATLRNDLYPILGLSSWDESGNPIPVAGIGGNQWAYQYTATVEIFGKVISSCPIKLMQLPHNPFYSGLLGRDTIFDEFGFGFWEITKELYVTENP